MWSAIFAFVAQRMLLLALHLEASSFPRPLSAGEERACFDRLHSAEDAAGRQQAREQLISHNLRLVSHIAKKYYAGHAQELDDLVSIGTVGLIKAVDTFNADRANRFSTYAARCVENEILMSFRAGRKNQNTVSIHEPIDTGDGQGLTIEDVVSDPRHMDEDAEDRQEARQVRHLVEQLTGRDRQIIVLRYGFGGQEPMTQQQVAEILGVSRSYVSRLESRVVAQLRGQLQPDGDV